MAKKSKKDQPEEEVIELTDVIEEGEEQDQAPSSPDSEGSGDELDFEKEFDELFSDLDVEEGRENQQESAKTPVSEEDDFDLDALFDELDSLDQKEEQEPEPSIQESPEASESSQKIEPAAEETEELAPEEPAGEAVDNDDLGDLLDMDFEDETEDEQISVQVEEQEPAAVEEETTEADDQEPFSLDSADEMDLETESAPPPPSRDLPRAGAGQAAVDAGDFEQLAARVQALEEKLAAAVTPDNLEERVAPLVDECLTRSEALASLEEGILEKIRQEMESRLEQLKADLEGKIEQSLQGMLTQESFKAFKGEFEDFKKGTADKEDLDSLSSSLKDEIAQRIRKEVPNSAAQIIREEIQALAQSLDDTED